MKVFPKCRRLFTIVFVGAILCLGTVWYIDLFYRRPMGTGGAGPNVDSVPFQQIWSVRRVQLLGIGDSVTAGLGAKSPSHSYFQRLLQNPSDEWEEMAGKSLQQVLPNIEPLNIAVSGTTSLHHADTIASLEPRSEYVFGLVVLTTGGNDLIHSYGRSPAREGAMYGATFDEAKPWIAQFGARLGLMLDNLTTLFPGGCEIYLANIYDPTDGVGDAASIWLDPWKDGLAIHSRYNEIIAQAADARPNVFLVPLHQTFLGHGSHCRQFWNAHYDANDPYHWFYTNIEDPNDRGYDAIRRLFLNTIIESSVLRPRSPMELR